jgi:hypothetical protein
MAGTARRVQSHGMLVGAPASGPPIHPNTMKITALGLLVLATLLVSSCNKQKAAIDARSDATQNAIDREKEAVDLAAKEALKQNTANAAIDKASIEAGKVTDQARLDAEKARVEAEAVAAKARVDAEKK